MCICVCAIPSVCVCARACVRACACVRVCVCVRMCVFEIHHCACVCVRACMCMRCVVRTEPSPVLCWITMSQMLRREQGSTPVVGSSSTTRRDPPMKAIEMDSLRFMPPDRVPTRLCLWACMPVSSKVLGRRGGGRTSRTHSKLRQGEQSGDNREAPVPLGQYKTILALLPAVECYSF